MTDRQRAVETLSAMPKAEQAELWDYLMEVDISFHEISTPMARIRSDLTRLDNRQLADVERMCREFRGIPS